MILRPLQGLYDAANFVKNKFYDLKWISQVKLNCPVISVGNISVGGTGKTPCVAMLAEEFRQRGFKNIIIISRSYKGSLKAPARVDLQNPQATEIFGDEPCLLQAKLPFCSVWAGPAKNETAVNATQAEVADLVIVDDGFSHRKLYRNLDLILIDATAPMTDFETLPVGRLREPLRAISRSHVTLVTKANLAPLQKRELIRTMILKVAPNNSKIFESESILQISDTSLTPGDSIMVFCGLGSPESLESALLEKGFKILKFQKFRDHHAFTDSELDQIEKQFNELKSIDAGVKLVTTAKDFVKCKTHAVGNLVSVVDYKLTLKDQDRSLFFDTISKHL